MSRETLVNLIRSLETLLNTHLSKELITLVISALPGFGLSISLPVAIHLFKLSWYYAFFLSVLGNMLPVPFILLFLNAVSRWLSKVSLFDRFFRWHPALSDEQLTHSYFEVRAIAARRASLFRLPALMDDPDETVRLQVALRRCDDALAWRQFPGRLVVKLDIEGSEYAFLQGAAQMLSTLTPPLLMEINPLSLRAARVSASSCESGRRKWLRW